MTDIIQQLIDGLGRGSGYALLALGLAIIFGVMHLVNFAHGEVITVSAYLGYWLSIHGTSWWLIALAALGASTLTAVIIEFVAFRRVRGSEDFTMLLTSFGVAIVVRAGFSMWVSTKPRQFDKPGWIFNTVKVFGISLEVYDLIVIGVTAVTLAAVAYLLRRTMFGVSLRAAAEDFDAARLMGIRANRVISGAFALSGLLAGVAAVMILMRRGQAEPGMGLDILLPGVLAAVIGGLGSLSGAVLGGFALGLAEVMVRAWILPEGFTGLTDGVVFALIAILFIFRPEGFIRVGHAERV